MVLETKSNTKESEREMNANELADYVDKCNAHDDEKLDQAADMLRQQQVEIEALKASRQLNNREILEVYSESDLWVPDRDIENLLKFANALLKKASEK